MNQHPIDTRSILVLGPDADTLDMYRVMLLQISPTSIFNMYSSYAEASGCIARRLKPHLILLDFERSPSMLDVDKLLSIADHFASPPLNIDEGRPLVVLASMWVRTSVFARACRYRGVDIICQYLSHTRVCTSCLACVGTHELFCRAFRLFFIHESEPNKLVPT